MQMSGERTIAADRAAVWAALNDPEVLKASIPGCQEMVRTSETGFEAKVAQKIGPVRATFTGEVELSDIVPGESYTISGKGKGGAAGGASGGAAVRLDEAAEGTVLSYDVEAKVTGKLAQLGSRLIDGFAKKFADEFFDRFKAEVEGPGTAEDADNGASNDAGAAEDGATAPASDAQVRNPTSPPISTAEAKVTAVKPPPASGDTPDGASGDAPQKKSWWARLFG